MNKKKCAPSQAPHYCCVKKNSMGFLSKCKLKHGTSSSVEERWGRERRENCVRSSSLVLDDDGIARANVDSNSTNSNRISVSRFVYLCTSAHRLIGARAYTGTKFVRVCGIVVWCHPVHVVLCSAICWRGRAEAPKSTKLCKYSVNREWKWRGGNERTDGRNKVERERWKVQTVFGWIYCVCRFAVCRLRARVRY